MDQRWGAGPETAAVMAKDDGARKKKRPVATDGAEGPAAKKKVKETQQPQPHRGGKGAATGDAEKGKGGKKGTEARTCAVCPDKPARDHLKPEEHRADSVFWCEECWAKFEKCGLKEEAASSHQGPTGKRARSAQAWSTEISKCSAMR